jgi:isoleucyl-tRNA synthetase
MLDQLPPVPDHVSIEEAILAWWDRERIFDRVRERNRGGPIFSFVDGPITANNPMGVHHAWGRTLKDAFQRYKAMRGFDQRYQNGFDCQGLWVEVGVEQSLGLNSKRDIEAYGLAEFADRCIERVGHYAEVITEQDRRLGRWMDWDDDYYTFSDTNIEYIWRFLAECNRRGWLYQGHRSTEWCPRCGTSISQHELFAGEYRELEHPSLEVRFPLEDGEDEALVVWTTTPWTLPANVAAAVRPDAEYGLRDGEWRLRTESADHYSRVAEGRELVGLRYRGPFDELPAQHGVVHRVIPWDEVALDEGTGIVHIAPGAGTEDFELSRLHGLTVLAPIDESGRMYPPYGEFAGLSTDEVAGPVIESLRERGLLASAGTIVHRYPTCWRCGTPLVFRVVDDWFISASEIRQPMLDANATVEWVPAHYGKRMDDWLRNMGDWNISRKRYFGLPLPLYPCDCGHLNVIGSRAELEERAISGLEQLRELHRPWIDEVPIRCESCGGEARRVPEVGDAWLDAGIVPFSTLGWENPEWVAGGYATGASRGLSGADLPDHAYWERWFPAHWISEMREQIRLWFYSQSFMSVTLVGSSPYRRVLTYEKLLDETGREMHRSWGNAISADDALRTMGADVMRWMFCDVNPGQNIRFGYGPAGEIKRRLLTLWNSVRFLVDYARVAGWAPGAEPGEPAALDRWLSARTDRLVAEATDAYERFWTPDVTAAFDRFVDDLSNWYIRRSRRRFWDGDPAALHALWLALVRGLVVIAPVMPFLAEHLWRAIRAEDGHDSVFLAPWPEPTGADADGLVVEIDEVRRVVRLGREARAESGLKLRQPLRRLVVQGASLAPRHVGEIRDELRVKDVEFREIEGAFVVTYRPNLPSLGRKGLGSSIPAIRAALERGEVEELPGGGYRVGEWELEGEDVLVEHTSEEGWQVAQDDGLVVALDLTLDEELRREGRVYDLTHLVNVMRKEAGLELTDRIRLALPSEYEDLRRYEERIKEETLAVSVDFGGSDEVSIAKA